MKENILKDKSYDFALKIIALCRIIQHDHKEFVLTKQLLRSGTAIGANSEEAIGGQSKRDDLRMTNDDLRFTIYGCLQPNYDL